MFSPWSSMNSAATTINSTTLGFTTGPADTLPPLDVGLVPTSGPYDFSAFNAPLDGTLETGDEVQYSSLTLHYYLCNIGCNTSRY